MALAAMLGIGMNTAQAAPETGSGSSAQGSGDLDSRNTNKGRTTSGNRDPADRNGDGWVTPNEADHYYRNRQSPGKGQNVSTKGSSPVGSASRGKASCGTKC